MKFGRFSSILLNLLISLFVLMLFSSFVADSDLISEVSSFSIQNFFEENWPILALFLSEIAALLPGKPKGILHAVIRALHKVYSKDYVSSKKFKS